MKKTCLILLLLVANGAAAQQQPLTVEKIMQDPKWIGTSPSNVVWAYDSKSLVFNWNPEKATSDSAYTYRINGDEPTKLGYNKAQLARAIADGVFDASHSKKAFVYNDDVYWIDIASGSIARITKTTEAESNVSFVMNNEWVAFQRGNNLYAYSLADKTCIQLIDVQKEKPSAKKLTEQDNWLQQQQLNTSAVLQKRKNKKDAAYKYLQEVKTSDTIPIIHIGNKQMDLLQISPDARFISYELYDAPANAKATIVPNYITENGYTATIESRGKAGEPLAKVSYFVYDKTRDTSIAINMATLPGIKDLPDYTKDYPAKPKDTSHPNREVNIYGLYWNEAATAAIVDIRSQDFKDRWLMQLDATTGKLSLVDRQRDEAWIGGPGIGWLDAGNCGWASNHQFYYQSEATGFSHLYMYDLDLKAIKPITKGNYEIKQATLSIDKKSFYIITNEEHPGKEQLYRINIDGSNKKQLTSKTGGYEVFLSPDEKYIAYRYSYQNKPWELYVQENGNNKQPIQVTTKAMTNEWKAYPWRDTKIATFEDRDGLPVYYRIYEPKKEAKNGAAVIFVHGAGYLQNVAYQWSYYYHEMMFNNLLADKGYTVIDLDYRASSGYGRNWRTAIYRYMGGKDLDDEVDAARMLAKSYGVDSTRIGIYGGSYGGFMTLMALFTQPNVFKAGAALRPVTDWGAYSDDYTSAILNRPYNDSLAYARSSPINFAKGLQNHLLICHGMVDVNVHYQDAVRLAQRLIELGKDNWELASYPVEDHGFVEPSSWTDEYKRILKLFDANLKN